MRSRYARYSEANPMLSLSALYATDAEGPAEGDLPRVEAPVFDGASAASDLADVVRDIIECLDHLEDAGLGAAIAGIRALVADLSAVQGYASRELYAETGRLETAHRLRVEALEARSMARDCGRLRTAAEEQASGLRESLKIRQEMLEEARMRLRVSDQLVRVLEEAERRGTVKRGTVNRWLHAADERVRGTR